MRGFFFNDVNRNDQRTDFPVFEKSTQFVGRSCLYLPSEDRYLHPQMGFLSHEELDFFSRQEKEWKENLPSFSLLEFLKIVPQGRSAAKRNLKAEIKKVKEAIRNLDQRREEYYNKVINPAPFQEQASLIEELNFRTEYWMERYDSRLKKLQGTLRLIDIPKTKSSDVEEEETETAPENITEEDIALAKEVPIKSFLKIESSKSVCIFHNEKTPSMHIYPDNHFFCFSCGKHGDVIDVVKELRHISFKESVKFLIGK